MPAVYPHGLAPRTPFPSHYALTTRFAVTLPPARVSGRNHCDLGPLPLTTAASASPIASVANRSLNPEIKPTTAANNT